MRDDLAGIDGHPPADDDDQIGPLRLGKVLESADLAARTDPTEGFLMAGKLLRRETCRNLRSAQRQRSAAAENQRTAAQLCSVGADLGDNPGP